MAPSLNPIFFQEQLLCSPNDIGTRIKGGIVGEDDKFIASTFAEDSWWDDVTEEEEDQSGRKVAIDISKKAKIDVKNVLSSDVPGVEDNNTLPSLHTKSGEDEEGGATAMQEILISPPPMRRIVANDELTITSNLTMDIRMDVVEINMGNLDSSVNHMSHLMSTFMKEMRQGSNQSPADFTANNNNGSAKVV